MKKVEALQNRIEELEAKAQLLRTDIKILERIVQSKQRLPITRQRLGQDIQEGLSKLPYVAQTELEMDNCGPLGGVSTKLEVISMGQEHRLYTNMCRRFAIQIYEL